MRFVSAVLVFLLLGRASLTAEETELSLSPTEQKFRTELANKTTALEKKNINAISGADGWLFLTRELRFLSHARFWGDAAAKVSRSNKSPDPLPAILDFHRQLQEHGITLLLVPVPPKAAIYPDKLGLETSVGPGATSPYLVKFYQELRAHEIDVLDLSEVFAQPPETARGVNGKPAPSICFSMASTRSPGSG